MIELTQSQEAVAQALADEFQSVQIAAKRPGVVEMTGGHFPDEDTFVPEVVFLINSLGHTIGTPSYLAKPVPR